MLLNRTKKGLASVFRSADAFLDDPYHLRAVSSALLVHKSVRNKISFQSTSEYNKRWQFKWKNAYYTYPRDGDEHTKVKRPEDSKDVVPLFGAWIQDFCYRGLPGLRMWWDRRNRMFDPFTVYFLPGISLAFYQCWDIAFGFKVLTLMPWFLLYTRLRDRTLDPDFKETYLRDMIYKNEKITKLFKEETIHVLDYNCEYIPGYPDIEKFPEYKNKTWRFFNTDSGMTEGNFKFGDVDSGATMNLKFKTMPVPGKFRYQVGEPFYFYDLRAEINNNGVFEEVVLVDGEEVLKRLRPFLFLI